MGNSPDTSAHHTDPSAESEVDPVTDGTSHRACNDNRKTDRQVFMVASTEADLIAGTARAEAAPLHGQVSRATG